jgi:hypothetical protein
MNTTIGEAAQRPTGINIASAAYLRAGAHEKGNATC